MDYILYFFLFSFFGWVLETVYAAFVYKRFVSKQTLLKSPLCPIYGIGALALMIALKPVSDSYILLFCGGFFIASSVEYLIAVYYEHYYNVMWWDYGAERGNLGGKVCVFNSIVWGIMTIVFFKVLLPLSERLIASVDGFSKALLCVLSVSFFMTDYRDTMLELKKYSKKEKSAADGKFVALKRINC